MNTEDFAGQLLKGEKIVWTGRPAQGILLTGRDAILIPFSLVWGGFAVFWEASVLTLGKAPTVFALFGGLFVLFGLYLIAGRFLVDAWLRSRTAYAITSSRILISRSGPFAKFTALKLDQMPNASLSERADGRGTIRFGPDVSFRGRGSLAWTPSLDPTPQFIAIEDARKIFNQIQQRGAGPQT